VLALFHPMGFGVASQIMPAVVCLAFLAKLWWARELTGVQQALFVTWLLAGAALQFASRDPWMWIAGFVGQITLAIVLVVKEHMDNIF
jgi:hypothetical protein